MSNNIEQIQDTLTFIFKKEDMQRIKIKLDAEGNPFITIDVHGWSKATTKKKLENIMLLFRGTFHMNIIHGYMHGIEIKKMLLAYKNDRIIRKRGYNENPGIFYMKFKEAA